MCRWIAYRGAETALAHYVTEPENSLISQSRHALEATSSTNGDGFGLGWYDGEPEPGLYHEIRPAWSDENLQHLCRHIRAHHFFAHVRASTGTAVMRSNCHPFVCGNWIFMHNGFIANWSRLRRSVERLIPDELYPSRLGTTDSEAIFLAIVGAGVAEDPLGATARTMTRLAHLVGGDAGDDKLRFTAALSNGRDLYAFRYAMNDGANSLYYRERDHETVIVSEPLDLNRASWTIVPENHAIVALHGEPARVMPFL
jgi:predicted glutamine amidotransferase